MTRSLGALRCLGTMARGAGEGFLAVAPDGTQYRFDWLVSRSYPVLTKPGPGPESLRAAKTSATPTALHITDPGDTPNVIIGYGLSRQEVWILPTLVTDRYGNTVTYSYDPAKPWRLLSIQSSDGRSITLGYDGTSNRVASVFDGTRVWSYSYASDVGGALLNRVTQPDGSAWQFAMGAFTRSAPMYNGSTDCDSEGAVNAVNESGSMTHPSGATGSFTTRATSHGRSFTDRQCRGDPADGTYAVYPIYIASKSIVNKTINGPGLPTLGWNYAYSPAGYTASWSTCAGNCADFKTVDVTDSRNVLTRYAFGTRYRVTEGQLQKVETGPAGGAFLRTTATHYRAPDAGPYAAYIGVSPQKRGNGDLASRNTPADQRVITQQGVNFMWQASGFDAMARPATVTRSSSLGASRTETAAYHDHSAKWVLGQTASLTEAGSGKVMLANTFDPGSANLLSTSRFGRLDQSFAYYTDGTLWTRADGAGHLTTFGNYKRGLAQNATYADGKTESAAINDIGLITSVTDANGFTTSYGYDPIGRLNLITRPSGDTVAWNNTSLAFESVPYAEYDLPAGHWRQTISTGNARTVIYFDALWRARLTRTLDASNDAGTARTVLRHFDIDNRKTFESYPARAIGSVYATPAGASTAYDALGRPVNSHADSELGVLTTTIDYLGGFQKRVTNPRGHATTTAYQAFDEPSEAAVSSIAAPETLTVGITRDVFGKPVSITRSGTVGGTVSATRSYVYDTNGRLCKTIEPEIGATIQTYDAANNTSWRATGLNLTSLASCDTASVPAAGKVSYGYDTRNRLISTSFGDGGPSITRTYTPDGLPNTVDSGGSTWTYGYNKRRLPELERLVYAGQTYNIGWRYNANAHVGALIFPAGPWVSYAPNALGEATAVGRYASNVTYHPNGAVAGYTLSNGIVHTLTQNTRGLPAQNRDAGVMQDQYAFDASGNVTAITDQQEGISTRSMGYDGLDRLTVANATGVWGSGSYAYDALDNLRSSVVGGRNSTHNYDGANRLSTINTNGVYTGYAYDGQGNITGRGSQGFYFDQANRMTLANAAASYAYDGLGRRTVIYGANGVNKVQVYSQAGQLLHGSQQQGMTVQSTYYVYLGGKQIAEVNTSTGATYAHTDALGSPVARTNASGGVTSRTRYEAYGNTAGGTIPNGIGFTGHVNDSDTGLVYMQQRYYDAIAGRFLSTDPVTTDANTGGSFGWYHYANNNPYRYTDPDGRDPWYRERPPPPPPPRTAPENLSFCQSVTGTNCGWGNYTSNLGGSAVSPASAANAPNGPYIEPTWEEIGAVADTVLAGVNYLVRPATTILAGGDGGIYRWSECVCCPLL